MRRSLSPIGDIMKEKELKIGDKVIIRRDICYPKIVGKNAVVILDELMFESDYVIVKTNGEIHACQKKDLTKVA